MAFDRIFIEYPILRDGVIWKVVDGVIDISYRDQGCVLELDGDIHIASNFLHKLEEGCESSSFTDLEESIVESLDKLGLITQVTEKKNKALLDGEGAFQVAISFIHKYQLGKSHSVFFNLMRSNEISKNQLIGYILEYLHITRMSHKILSASMIHHDNRLEEDELLKFFSEELFHDRLIEKSLSCIGYSRDNLKYLNALPSTFGICTTLFSIAFQHPLSFKVALFLFEKEFKEFDSEFKRNSQRLGLPKGFVSPILKHADINNHGNHDEISITLLKNIDVVSDRDLIFIKQNLMKLSQLMSWQDKEVTQYYSNENNKIPRI